MCLIPCRLGVYDIASIPGAGASRGLRAKAQPAGVHEVREKTEAFFAVSRRHPEPPGRLSASGIRGDATAANADDGQRWVELTVPVFANAIAKVCHAAKAAATETA